MTAKANGRARDEAHLPAESGQETTQARVPSPYEDPRGSRSSQTQTAEGPEASDCLRGLEVARSAMSRRQPRAGESPQRTDESPQGSDKSLQRIDESPRRSDERLPRSDRLLLSKDFQRVARQGKRVASRDFVMLIAPARRAKESVRGPRPSHPGDVRRLGVTASRKVGAAVTRNRVKRGIREWFRHSRKELGRDVDVVVIARRGSARLTGAELSVELARLSRRVDRG